MPHGLCVAVRAGNGKVDFLGGMIPARSGYRGSPFEPKLKLRQIMTLVT